MADRVLPQYRDRIVHASLELDGYELSGADTFAPDHYLKPAGFFMTINMSDVNKAKQLFATLSEGGTLFVPLEKTFWADAYASFTDRFGAPWEINCSQSEGK